MKLTMVYDNEVFTQDRGLRSDWGFSCLIETGYEVILFDTGADGNILVRNMDLLGIDPNAIDKVVISHEHRDHFGGLKALIERSAGPPVYRLIEDPALQDVEQIVVDGQKEISKNVFTTGPLTEGPVPEQSLYLECGDGWYVLTGCSHPGIENILASGKDRPVKGLIGGFHGFRELDRLSGLSLVCPAHCTKEKERILRRYPGSAVKAGVGRVLEM
ncbi:MAG: MBL fold metallo-hydrolase [Candidatus Thermoplasmatota archaeon]|nr:MBL fold metallo-hydrolase [Candidatus Thermoplasmatota archaeon]